MPGSIKPVKKLISFVAIASLVFFSLSCSNTKKKVDAKIEKASTKDKAFPFDPQVGLTRAEIKNTLVKERKADNLTKTEPNRAPIPSLTKMIITPPPPVIGGEKLISFSATEQIPLKDVLIELARVAKIDIDLDPKISGGIIINAKNRPLKEVIDRIATLGNLRYSYKNGVLYFESDTAYLKNYFVDYLVDGKLWADVETNISSILNATATSPESSLLNSSDSSSTSTTSESSTKAASFTSNKSAGIIAIFATNKQHEAVEKYLGDVEKSASAQVLIEAKMVEVTLKQDYKAGIDWTKLGANNIARFNDGGSASGATLGSTAYSYMPFSATLTDLFGNNNLKASIAALEAFGTTRTLSSPRIHAINNQKSTMLFDNKLVYFTITANQSNTSTGSGTPVIVSTITSTKQEESVGLNIEITPSINLKTQEITLNVKPKITNKSGEVIDPASNNSLLNNTTSAGVTPIQNVIPVIQTRELNTSAKIRSGNILVIGGLMEESSINNDIGTPILSKIPVLGWLFKSTEKSSKITETVIFIKATIINSSSNVTKYDRDFQEKFDSTKRQFFN